jgi:predicted amidohydrolase
MRLVLLQPQLQFAPEADNLGRILAALKSAGGAFERDDIVLLPESFHRRANWDAYERDMSALAGSLHCHVIGGAHHRPTPAGLMNSGLAFDADGAVIGRYDKLRPYASERACVQPGSARGELVIAGRCILVLVCSDFWFAEVVQQATRLPDVILVAALSVSRKAGPDYSRMLWRHLAVSRAYEFSAYVGISDWAYPSELPVQFASGVGGFADPTTITPEGLFTPMGKRSSAVHVLDFRALDEFRKDRISRGFFWKSPQDAHPDDIEREVHR